MRPTVSYEPPIPTFVSLSHFAVGDSVRELVGGR